MPGTKSVAQNKKELRRKHPDWPKDRITAVALDQARRAGADIPKPKKKR